jgi:hypothetical protein
VAIYHLSIKHMSRSNGKSAVASSAYRAGEKLEEKETGKTHDYTRKNGVVHNEVMLPNHAPKEYQNREVLWNEVQKVEKQSNARLAREIEVGLPKEMSREQQIQCVRDYVQNNFVKEGMCADVALHDKGDGNPHAHIMLTTRGIKENGKWDSKERRVLKLDENGERIPVIDKETGLQKIRDRGKKGIEYVWERETVKANNWNDKSKIEEWRKAWAEECNKYLSQEQKIDHRSYARQGIDREPTIHEGQKARKMEQEGAISDRCEINRQIKEYNSLQKTVANLQESRENITSKIKEKMREINGQLERIRDDFGRKFRRDASRDARPISELVGNGSGERETLYRERQAQSANRETQCGERQVEWRKREVEQREQQAQPRESVLARQGNEQTIKPKPQEQAKMDTIPTEEQMLDKLYEDYKKAYKEYDEAISRECSCGFLEWKKKKECKAETERTRQKLGGIENELAKYGIQREYGEERIKRVGEHVQWKKREIREQAERKERNERRPNHNVKDMDERLNKAKEEQARRKDKAKKQEKTRGDGFSQGR